MMLNTSAARLSHASTSNICTGCQRWAQSDTVATSTVIARLITTGIAASDQRAIRGQLATIARPGTKKVNARTSTIRPGPTRFRYMTAISNAVMMAASRSSASAHCVTGCMIRGYRLNIPQVWTRIRFSGTSSGKLPGLLPERSRQALALAVDEAAGAAGEDELVE